MTQMSDALTAALKPKPMIERVWNWLKDHPNKTAKDVASAFSIPHNRGASACLELKYRSMVTVTKGPDKLSGRQGVLRYSAVGTTYVLKPVKRPAPKKDRVKQYHKDHPLLLAPPASQEKPLPTGKITFATPVAEENIKALVDGFTVRAAHLVYLQLHAMFNHAAKV